MNSDGGLNRGTGTVKPTTSGALLARSDEARRKRTVLVVDDLETLRAFLCEFLEDTGYQVLSATNGQEALETANRFADGIDLLLTDLEMPGMDGFALAEALLMKRPRTRVLFISGEDSHYSFPTERVRDRLFLKKPFGVDKLRAKIAETLA